jgi:hypothetical protein
MQVAKFMETTSNSCRLISQIGFALLTLAIVRRLASLAIAYFFLLPPNGNPWLIILSHHIPLYLFGLPVFIFCMKFIPNGSDIRPKEQVKISHSLMALFAGYGFSSIINYLMVYILSALALFFPLVARFTTDALPQQSGLDAALAGLFMGAGVAGFGEEFIFRKLLYKKMANSSDVLYILVSGITFGIIHNVFSMGIGHCLHLSFLKTP